jgi:Transposase DDE domain
LRDRSASFRSQQHQRHVEAQAQRLQSVDFFNVLTGPELLERTEALLPEHREREYPPTVALSMFLKQALEEDRSCQKAVNSRIAQCVSEGLRPPSANTGGYSKARQRIPVEMVTALTHEVSGLLCSHAPAGWRWRGRTVKLADGTGISMQDTEENQARYPQPSSQAEGVGFPLMRLTGVVCLSTGAVLDVAMGPHAGKGNSELGLFRQLEKVFSAGDLMLGDALYCNYFVVARLQALGVDVLFEQHGSRTTDFRRGKSLGTRDHLVSWSKPKARPQWMSPQEYATFPAQLTVRELESGGRVLVTTLLGHRKVSKRELSKLYEHRWNVELDFRNIKTTLGLEVLSCKTPQMSEKELWVYMLAYNLIRLLMAQAAQLAGTHPRLLSFKHTVQIWTEWVAQGLAGMVAAHNEILFRTIAQRKVGNRPGRIEPRARKRRPKSYQWLKVSREKARQQIQLHGYLPNPST